MSILTLTPAAEKQIDLLSEENNCYGITLNIKGGGCAGFEYEWGTIAHSKRFSSRRRSSKNNKWVCICSRST